MRHRQPAAAQWLWLLPCAPRPARPAHLGADLGAVAVQNVEELAHAARRQARQLLVAVDGECLAGAGLACDCGVVGSAGDGQTGSASSCCDSGSGDACASWRLCHPPSPP